MAESVYAPLLDSLADHEPRTLGQIERTLGKENIAFAQIAQAVVVLVGMGHLASVHDDAVIDKVRKRTERLNRYIMGKARSSGDIAYLASPVTGGGINVDRFQQLFLLALGHGRKRSEEWARMAWEILAGQGQRLVKQGKALETPEENLAELTARATEFADKRLPLLRALRIV